MLGHQSWFPGTISPIFDIISIPLSDSFNTYICETTLDIGRWLHDQKVRIEHTYTKSHSEIRRWHKSCRSPLKKWPRSKRDLMVLQIVYMQMVYILQARDMFLQRWRMIIRCSMPERYVYLWIGYLSLVYHHLKTRNNFSTTITTIYDIFKYVRIKSIHGIYTNFQLSKIQGKDGLVIGKTVQAIIVARYVDPMIAGNTAETVQKLVDYLVKVGY